MIDRSRAHLRLPNCGPKGGPKWRRKRWTVLYNALNPLKAKQLGPGKFSDGQGLWLVKRSREHGKWIVRLAVQGARREMGLGRWPDVTLAEARERAAAARRRARDGVDPVAERQKSKRQPGRITMADAIHGCFKARQAELKHDGVAGRWMSPMNVHVIPKIGKTAIEDVDQHVLLSVLEPIWHEKPDVAEKALNRMNLTLKHAAALGLNVDLQAPMKARALLGKQRHVVTHIPSLPYQDAPVFYRLLCQQETITALALRFLMLTVTRTSEVRFATFDEIDNDVWHLSPKRTKTGREHRVPLTDEALAVLDKTPKDHPGRLIFPSRTGGPLSDAAMAAFMKREGFTARPHGLRATFRTWAENETDADWETKESALGHVVGNQVERAYQRSDIITKRRTLLDNWASFTKNAKS